MKPTEIFTGNWGVVNERGELIKSGLATNAEAWRWIDRQDGEPISRSENVAEWVWNKTTERT